MELNEKTASKVAACAARVAAELHEEAAAIVEGFRVPSPMEDMKDWEAFKQRFTSMESQAVKAWEATVMARAMADIATATNSVAVAQAATIYRGAAEEALRKAREEAEYAAGIARTAPSSRRLFG